MVSTKPGQLQRQQANASRQDSLCSSSWCTLASRVANLSGVGTRAMRWLTLSSAHPEAPLSSPRQSAPWNSPRYPDEPWAGHQRSSRWPGRHRAGLSRGMASRLTRLAPLPPGGASTAMATSRPPHLGAGGDPPCGRSRPAPMGPHRGGTLHIARSCDVGVDARLAVSDHMTLCRHGSHIKIARRRRGAPHPR